MVQSIYLAIILLLVASIGSVSRVEAKEITTPAGIKTPAVVNKMPSRKMMIPPPPPHVPTLHGGHGSVPYSAAGMPLDYVDTTELKRMKVELELRVEQLTKKVAERSALIEECSKKVRQFESLFVEGVVSKRDVAGVKKDLAEAQEKDADIDAQFIDAKKELARIDKHLGDRAKMAEKAQSNKQPSKKSKK